MAQYEISFETYKGPLEKLLEFIEERQLEITRVNLADVTGDFLAYIESLKVAGETNPQLVADFLVVASKLILIKSKALLPTLEVTEEEEADMRDLEFRLRVYQKLKSAERHIKAQWNVVPAAYSREFLQSSEPLFYPPSSVSGDTLCAAIRLLTGELERFLKPTAALRTEIVNLKKKIEEVIARLTDVPRRFAELHSGERREIIVLFLAILHMIKDQLVVVDQENHFSEMVIAKKTGAA